MLTFIGNGAATPLSVVFEKGGYPMFIVIPDEGDDYLFSYSGQRGTFSDLVQAVVE